jgi:hypothetical protein
MDTAATLAIDKLEYQNNTSGWIGVVILDHDGKPTGVNVEPGGTIWLSEQEAILTARAPRRAEDNPFEEREYIVMNDGRREPMKMRPLTLVSGDAQSVKPNDRFVPGVTQDAEARAEIERAAHDGSPTAIRTDAQVRAEAAVTGSTPQQGVPVPPAPVIQPGAPEASDGETEYEEGRESWTEPEAPGQVLQGSLQGDDGVEPDLSDPTESKPGDVVHQQPAAVAQTVGAQGAPEEEHAQQVDQGIGEETGAARPPVGDQPEGEYAIHEEVGTPLNEDDTEGLIG